MVEVAMAPARVAVHIWRMRPIEASSQVEACAPASPPSTPPEKSLLPVSIAPVLPAIVRVPVGSTSDGDNLPAKDGDDEWLRAAATDDSSEGTVCVACNEDGPCEEAIGWSVFVVSSCEVTTVVGGPPTPVRMACNPMVGEVKPSAESMEAVELLAVELCFGRLLVRVSISVEKQVSRGSSLPSCCSVKRTRNLLTPGGGA